MKRTTIRNAILTTIFALFSIAQAEEANPTSTTETVGYKTVTFDVGLVPGISYGSIVSGNQKIRDKYAFNLIAGRCDQLEKFAIAPAFNWVREDANGTMLAGIGNYAGGELNGIQLAGLLNVANREQNGIGLAGLMNHAGAELNGIGLAGFANASRGEQNGLLFAGGFNLTMSELNGLAFAGIANIASREENGMLAAGLMNYGGNGINGFVLSGGATIAGKGLNGFVLTGGIAANRGSTNGFITTGGMNLLGESANGMIIAGGANFIGDDMNGMEIAGVTNVVAGKANGMQVSGLFNYAHKMNGAQIGLINLSTESNGALIGAVSYSAKHGAKAEVYADEIGNTYLALRTGNRDWYNRLVIGYAGLGTPRLTTIGAGFGKINRGDFFHTEYGVEVYEINFANDLSFASAKETATLGKIVYTVNVKPIDNLEIFVGPSYNLYYSHHDDGAKLASMNMSKANKAGTKDFERTWIGVFGGIRLH